MLLDRFGARRVESGLLLIAAAARQFSPSGRALPIWRSAAG
jgi:hypothetical protein